jgi:putative ATPase
VFEERARGIETGQGRCSSSTRSTASTRAQQDSFAGDGGRHHRAGRRHHREPSFELIAPLLSRARVPVFKPLDAAAIEKLLARAETIEGGMP